MSSYHINPSTGRVGVCHAPSIGECKFVKGYKKSKFNIEYMHFDFQEEALRYAQAYIWKEKKSRRKSQKQYPKDMLNPYSKYHELEELYLHDEREALKKIYKTNDVEILKDVFERRLCAGDHQPARVAVLNPNFPTEIKDHIVMKPDRYSKQFILSLFSHKLSEEKFPFTKEQLNSLHNNTDSQEILGITKRILDRYGWWEEVGEN
jgi:hypothetical protein